MSEGQLSRWHNHTSVVSSSKLFLMVLTEVSPATNLQPVCLPEELAIVFRSLDAYCGTKTTHPQWQKLLQAGDPHTTENPAWNSYIGPVLAFKLYSVLSGSAAIEGKVPRTTMSHELTQGITRVAKCITEKNGWPTIFADAIVARWNTNVPATIARATVAHRASHMTVDQKVAASVVQNLRELKNSRRSKYMLNILQNIELAASYLAIMTIGLVDVPMDNDFPAKLKECLRNAGSHSDSDCDDILQALDMSLVEFQAPLFCCLAVSPILLFRTCLLQSSRFGRHLYLSFMMCVGDTKPERLRQIESLIWTNLYLVARCRMTPTELMNTVLDSIVDPETLEAFHMDKMKFCDFLRTKFESIDNHTSYFFPALGAIIKQEGKTPAGTMQSGLHMLSNLRTPFQTPLHPGPSSSFSYQFQTHSDPHHTTEEQGNDQFSAYMQFPPTPFSRERMLFTMPSWCGYDSPSVSARDPQSGMLTSRIISEFSSFENPSINPIVTQGRFSSTNDQVSAAPHPRRGAEDQVGDSCSASQRAGDQEVASVHSPSFQDHADPSSTPISTSTPGANDVGDFEPSPASPGNANSRFNDSGSRESSPLSPSPDPVSPPPEPVSSPPNPAVAPSLKGKEKDDNPGAESVTPLMIRFSPSKLKSLPRKRAKSPSHRKDHVKLSAESEDSDEDPQPASVPTKRKAKRKKTATRLAVVHDSDDVEMEDGERNVKVAGSGQAAKGHSAMTVIPADHRVIKGPKGKGKEAQSDKPQRHGQQPLAESGVAPMEIDGNPQGRKNTLGRISAPPPPPRKAKRSTRPKSNKTSDDETSSEDESSEESDINMSDASIPRLKVKGDEPRISSPVIHVYSADQSMYYPYHGRHYSQEIANELQTLATHVKTLREDSGLPVGAPPEWKDGMTEPVCTSSSDSLPDDYPIYTLEYEQYLELSAQELQDILREYPAIVVTGRPTRLSCDLESLEEWGGVDELREMHDNSRYDSKNPGAVHVRASYREFLQTEKNLNSLDNPLSGGFPAPHQLATELRATVAAYDDFPTCLPMYLLTWGLLAKRDAFHPVHGDKPGLCTFVAVEAGLKKWDLGFPPEDGMEDEIADPDAYGYEMAAERNFARGWRWYSVLLHPGTLLIMRPGTIHSVTTLQDSVALGGHFICSSTMKHSIFSIYHTFVGHSTITNVTPDHEHEMMLRIILFWHRRMCSAESDYMRTLRQGYQNQTWTHTLPHLPNVLIFGDFINLCALLNYAELVLVLTPSRYNVPCLVSFQQAVYRVLRKHSREMRRWLQNNFLLLLDPPCNDGYNDETRLEEMMLDWFLRHAHLLWDSVRCREQRGVVGAKCFNGHREEEITAIQVYNALCQDIGNFIGRKKWSRWTAQLAREPPLTYSWPAPPTGSEYVLKLRPGPHSYRVY